MNLQTLNKQVVTFGAICLLFMGSLYYFISVAFKDRDALENRQNARIMKDYLDALE